MPLLFQPCSLEARVMIYSFSRSLLNAYDKAGSRLFFFSRQGVNSNKTISKQSERFFIGILSRKGWCSAIECASVLWLWSGWNSRCLECRREEHTQRSLLSWNIHLAEPRRSTGAVQCMLMAAGGLSNTEGPSQAPVGVFTHALRTPTSHPFYEALNCLQDLKAHFINGMPGFLLCTDVSF